MEVRTKLCGAYCGEWKPVESFYTHPRSSDGYRWACKKCLTRYARERRQGKKFQGVSDGRFALYESNLKRLQEILPRALKKGVHWTHPTQIVGTVEAMHTGLILERMSVGGLYEGWALRVRMSGRFELFPLASFKLSTLALHLAEKDIEVL